MRAHGHTTYEWHGNVLHTFPRGNFNEQGILDHMDRLTELTQEKDKWVLFERPQMEAGITPEAIVELVKAYEGFAQQGCIMIITEVPGVFGSSIEKACQSVLSIPYKHSTDPELLLEAAEAALANS